MRRRDIFDFAAGRLERLTSARDFAPFVTFCLEVSPQNDVTVAVSLVHKQTRSTHTHSQRRREKKNEKRKTLASSFQLRTHSCTHTHGRPLPSSSSSSLLPEAQRYFYLPQSPNANEASTTQIHFHDYFKSGSYHRCRDTSLSAVVNINRRGV